MNLFKSLLLSLLALSLIIRPVFAEGVMMHNDSSSQVSSAHTDMMHYQMNSSHSDMSHNHHAMMNHGVQDQTQSTHSAMLCCEEGLHICALDCSDESCIVFSVAPVFQTTGSTDLISVEQATLLTPKASSLITRTISPEQRPPLFNS
ncbi:MAG: hypothetical protein U9N57_10145 [Pseudomonadota bacterium]|nr:hypothetical protein [Pseudomonadota bacterium]